MHQPARSPICFVFKKKPNAAKHAPNGANIFNIMRAFFHRPCKGDAYNCVVGIFQTRIEDCRLCNVIGAVGAIQGDVTSVR